MLEQSLTEELTIPRLGGTLIAEFVFSDPWKRAERESKFDDREGRQRLWNLYRNNSLPENYEYRWKVFFWFDGPDKRYNGAGVNISSDNIPQLTQDFKTALAVVQQLGTSDFTATYNRRIGTLADPKLEVIGSKGVFGLQFSMRNEHQILYKTLDADHIEVAIGKLQPCIIRGPELIETLRTLTQPPRLS
jgi:hypothetical protein